MPSYTHSMAIVSRRHFTHVFSLVALRATSSDKLEQGSGKLKVRRVKGEREQVVAQGRSGKV